MKTAYFSDLSNEGVVPASAHQKRLGWGFALFFLALFAASTLIIYFANTSRYEVSVDDFFIEWKGAQVALQGGDPYSDATTLLIQAGLHRYNVPTDQDQLAFVYPYWRVFYNAPIAFLPYDWAAAIWVGFLLALFISSIYLVSRTLSWKPKSPIQQLALYLSLILAFPTFASTMLGQVALLDGALLAIIYYCLRSGAQSWAGIWLALATVKPQLVAVLTLLLLGRAIWRHEWRFVITFGLTLTVLVLTSFLAYPKWLAEFLAGINRYPGYKKTLTGPGFVFDGLGIVGSLLTVLTWLIIAAIGLWLWWREANKSIRIITQVAPPGTAFDLSFCAGLIMTLLLPPQTNIVNAVLLLVPIILLMVRWSKAGQNARFYLMAVATIVVSWAFYLVLFSDFYGWLIVGPVSIVTMLLFFNFKTEILTLFRRTPPIPKEVSHAT